MAPKKEKEEKEPEIDTGADDLSEEEKDQLAAESVRVEEEKARKAEEKRKEREQKEGTAEQERMYSKAEVQAMLKEFALTLKKDTDLEDLDDEDIYKQKKVRIPRFQNKFVFAFKNTNTDEYFPDLVIHAFDIWNEQTKRNDPWVTAVFEDGTTQNVPLYTILTRSQKVWVDLVEVIQKDISYSAGRVERAEIKDYSRSGSGVFVKAKVSMTDNSYKIKLPTGKEVIVGKEVINW